MLILTDDFAESDLIGHDDYRDGLVEMIQEVKARGLFHHRHLWAVGLRENQHAAPDQKESG